MAKPLDYESPDTPSHGPVPGAAWIIAGLMIAIILTIMVMWLTGVW